MWSYAYETPWGAGSDSPYQMPRPVPFEPPTARSVALPLIPAPESPASDSPNGPAPQFFGIGLGPSPALHRSYSYTYDWNIKRQFWQQQYFWRDRFYERWEWVEIIEPRTQEHMYANLTTGECVWDPPPGVKIKKTDDNQWWELFDQNTSRFYYYNATSQKTVWHRPQNCDIIPLAKLQTLKQNTEVREDDAIRKAVVKCEMSTQTPTTPKREPHPHQRSASVRTTNSAQTSPYPGNKKYHHRSGSGRNYTKDERYINGERSHHRRRGSTPASGHYHRKESGESPHKSVESPRPHRSRESSRGSVDSGGSYSSVSHGRSASYDSTGSHTGTNTRGSLDSSASHSRSSRDSPVSRSRTSGDNSQNRTLDNGSQTRYYDSGTYSRDSGSQSQSRSSLDSAVQATTTPRSVDNTRTYHADTLPARGHSHHGHGGHGYESSHSRSSYDSSPQSRGSLDNAPAILQQQQQLEEFNRSDYPPPYNPEQIRQLVEMSPMLSSKPKRSFPRTNPSYVGVPRRDGTHLNHPPPAYKRINSQDRGEQYYAERGTDSSDTLSLLENSGIGLQTSLGSSTEFNDNINLGLMYKHDRSDSEASHSSHRGGSHYHDRSDSQTSQSSLSRTMRDHPSDSHSSQGSLRNILDSHSSHHSSQGSIRNMQGEVRDSSSQGSLRYQQLQEESEHKSYQSPDVEFTRFPLNVAHIKPPSEDFPIYQEIETVTQEQHSGDSLDMRSADSLSPQEYMNNRQDTPGSERSVGNSSCASEGEPGAQEQEDYEDSDNSSVFSTPSPKPRNKAPPPPTLPLDVHHASLRRKRIVEKSESATPISVLEKSVSMQAELAMQRPLSMVVASHSEANMMSPGTNSLQRPNRGASVPSTRSSGSLSKNRKPGSDSEIENYAIQNLNVHKKGLLGKKVSIAQMLAWSKELITKPMIKTNDKAIKKESCETFKLIQMYMGDRRSKSTLPQIALEIAIKGWSLPTLRDELYIQLCRQTTDNISDDSLMRGWELMAICLNFFPPSMKFHSYLEGYICRHLDPMFDTECVPISHFAQYTIKKLERAVKLGAKKGLRKPTLDEVEQARRTIFHPSMFGSTMEEVMMMQRERFPNRRLPWIQTVLSEEVLRLDGAQTEGIFRVPGDIDEVNALKVRCDQWIPPTDCPDPHIPASLLKLWFRELYEPIIPNDVYEQCIENYANPEAAVDIVMGLPEINKLVLCYLIRFLQVFAAIENAQITKMDINNLAMVMAPNCLRCESEDPRIIFENTRKEMAFVRTLIQHLDTSFMEGVI
ncbi:uncharacterized protein LOC135492671 isoform X2 [Lineus longissimus]|uniref:uncharacterized protein LOC135492671 isoform X2 n=1 Tax=Lineus longissimus TaxID=88925 RepID=UPI00315DC640